MNIKNVRMIVCMLAGLALAAASGCAASSDATNEEDATQASTPLINNGGLGVDGDACSITGGPNKGKTGTRSGDYCCTEPNGQGHCQDCTTPSGWCGTSVIKGRFGGIVAAPIGTAVFAR